MIALVVLALILLIIGTLNTDDTFTKAAGYVTFAFAALGTYLFLSAASVATGGRAYPLGSPLVRGDRPGRCRSAILAPPRPRIGDDRFS